MAFLSLDLHKKWVVPTVPSLRQFKGSTFNDHTPLPIFRITSCSEASRMDVFLQVNPGRTRATH
jgi:hypothetical protein